MEKKQLLREMKLAVKRSLRSHGISQEAARYAAHELEKLNFNTPLRIARVATGKVVERIRRTRSLWEILSSRELNRRYRDEWRREFRRLIAFLGWGSDKKCPFNLMNKEGRLVAADWLEENGQLEYASLLRVDFTGD